MEPGQQSANGATSSHAINASPPRSQYTMDSTGMMTDRIAMNHPHAREWVHAGRFRRSIGCYM